MKTKLLLTFIALLWIGRSQAQDYSTISKRFSVNLDSIKSNLDRNNLRYAVKYVDTAKQNLSNLAVINQYNLDNQRKEFEVKLNILNDTIQKRNDKIVDLRNTVTLLKSSVTESTLKAVEGIMQRADEYKNLEKERDDFKTKIALLQGDTLILRKECKILNENYTKLQDELKTYASSVKFGLSIGFNLYANNQLEYIVQNDGKISEEGSRTGVSGILSGVVSIRTSKKLTGGSIVINIPLGDFTSNSNSAIGIFNNRVAVGLGYSLTPFNNVPNLAFSGIFNLSPYQRLNYDRIKDKIFNLPEYTRLKPEDYGAINDICYSFTFGLVYSFANIGGKNSK